MECCCVGWGLCGRLGAMFECSRRRKMEGRRGGEMVMGRAEGERKKRRRPGLVKKRREMK